LSPGMKETAELMKRIFPVIILSVIAGLSGCADDESNVADRIQNGIVEGVSTMMEGSEGEETSAGSAAVRKAEESPVEPGEPDSDGTSLIYTREYYTYRVRKKKDPFLPLLTEGGQLEGLTLNEMTLTGILWGEDRSLVVMEDSKGRGYMMQVGDKIAGAKLVAIREDAAVFRVVEFGVVHNIEKKLFIQEEKPI